MAPFATPCGLFARASEEKACPDVEEGKKSGKAKSECREIFQSTAVRARFNSTRDKSIRDLKYEYPAVLNAFIQLPTTDKSNLFRFVAGRS